MKTKLKATEFWNLVGVQTLAATLNAQLAVLVRATATITGEDPEEADIGHACDFIYGPDSTDAADAVRAMLRKLGVEFETEFPKEDDDG